MLFIHAIHSPFSLLAYFTESKGILNSTLDSFKNPNKQIRETKELEFIHKYDLWRFIVYELVVS